LQIVLRTVFEVKCACLRAFSVVLSSFDASVYVDIDRHAQRRVRRLVLVLVFRASLERTVHGLQQ